MKGFKQEQEGVEDVSNGRYLSVYKEIENAAEIERKTESDDFWDCDCTWAEGDEIHLGHPSKNFADCNVEHIFKVTLHNVNEEI